MEKIKKLEYHVRGRGPRKTCNVGIGLKRGESINVRVSEWVNSGTYITGKSRLKIDESIFEREETLMGK